MASSLSTALGNRGCMAQGSQDWQLVLQISISLLGLAGGFTAFVFNQRIKGKDEKIQDLKENLEKLQSELEDAECVKKELQGTVVSLINNQEDSLNPKVLEILNSVIGKLQIDKIQKRELEDYKSAAKWLRCQNKELVKSALKETMRTHRSLIPRMKKRRFEDDVKGCLEWVYVCLNFYGHPDISMERYVNTPAIDSSIPYIFAIRHVQSFEKIKALDKR